MREDEIFVLGLLLIGILAVSFLIFTFHYGDPIKEVVECHDSKGLKIIGSECLEERMPYQNYVFVPFVFLFVAGLGWIFFHEELINLSKL